MWTSHTSPLPSPSSISGSPTISHTPFDLSFDLSPRLSKVSRRRSREAQEILRIMDPSYLSPQPPMANRCSARSASSDYYYVDAQGHLHDIDYRPFPPIRQRDSFPKAVDADLKDEDTFGGTFARPSPRRSHTSPLPQPRSIQVPYWETFTPPPQEYLDISEEVTFQSTRTVPKQQTYSYAKDTTAYAIHGYTISSGAHVDEKTGRRVLTKPRDRDVSEVKHDDSDDAQDDGEQEELLEARTQGDEGRRMTMGPKEKLRQTWVATSFDLRLKVIRTQRWLREHVQGQ